MEKEKEKCDPAHAGCYCLLEKHELIWVATYDNMGCHI